MPPSHVVPTHPCRSMHCRCTLVFAALVLRPGVLPPRLQMRARPSLGPCQQMMASVVQQTTATASQARSVLYEGFSASLLHRQLHLARLSSSTGGAQQLSASTQPDRQPLATASSPTFPRELESQHRQSSHSRGVVSRMQPTETSPAAKRRVSVCDLHEDQVPTPWHWRGVSYTV
ncbi:hypothetical protein VTI74DRAFT_9774 [Chaetomium olivicolor]